MNVWNELTTDLAVYGGVGTLLPLLISIINRPHFPRALKQVIMVAVALAVGIVTYGAKSGWNFTSPAHVVVAVLGVIVATQVAYRLIWKQGVAPAIESNVNAGKSSTRHADVAPDSDAVELSQEDNPYYDAPIPEQGRPRPSESDPGAPAKEVKEVE